MSAECGREFGKRRERRCRLPKGHWGRHSTRRRIQQLLG